MKRIKKPKLITLPRTPQLPTELAIIEDQLRTGVIRFRSKWEVWHHSPEEPDSHGIWRPLRGKYTAWKAGSMEEVLHAVESGIIAVTNTPGVSINRRERCPRCNRWIKYGGFVHHTQEICDRVIAEQRAGPMALARTKWVEIRKWRKQNERTKRVDIAETSENDRQADG